MTQEAERQATSRAPHSGLQRLFEQYGTAHIVDEHYETAVSSNLGGIKGLEIGRRQILDRETLRRNTASGQGRVVFGVCGKSHAMCVFAAIT